MDESEWWLQSVTFSCVWVAIFQACEGMVRVDLEADAVW